jgi:hypothetical protein
MAGWRVGMPGQKSCVAVVYKFRCFVCYLRDHRESGLVGVGFDDKIDRAEIKTETPRSPYRLRGCCSEGKQAV